MAANQTIGSSLIKEMVLRALAHDFYTPFRALASAISDIQGMDRTGALRLQPDEVKNLNLASKQIRDVIWPALSELNTSIQRSEIDNIEDFIMLADMAIGRDVNSVASAIKQFYESVDRRLNPRKRQGKFDRSLKDIKLGRRKIVNMISLTWDKSLRPPSEGSERVNLSRVATDAIALYRSLGSVSRSSSVYGQATINAHNAQISICIANLVSNSVKYRKGDGPAQVDVLIQQKAQKETWAIARRIHRAALQDDALGEEGRVYANFLSATEKHCNWIEILVRDEGIGIPPDKTWSIFQLYKQLRSDDYSFLKREVQRTLDRISEDYLYEVVDAEITHRRASHYGYGLALTQCFIRLHSGEIMVDSREGGPTTFGIWLPTLGAPTNVVQEWWPRASKDPWWES
jgi:signal transduction histidine kinase